jgi:hypothetical protein
MGGCAVDPVCIKHGMEKLPYHRLVLAVGSTIPPIMGFGVPGTFVLPKTADAIELRAYNQRRGARQALVAGGGLLSLEAAYALYELGLQAGMLERSDRLLRRQLDTAGSGLLRAYLEETGVRIIANAECGALRAISSSAPRRTPPSSTQNKGIIGADSVAAPPFAGEFIETSSIALILRSSLRDTIGKIAAAWCPAIDPIYRTRKLRRPPGRSRPALWSGWSACRWALGLFTVQH